VQRALNLREFSYCQDGSTVLHNLNLCCRVQENLFNALLTRPLSRNSIVNEWMRANRLRLNQTKTQITWLGSGQQLKQVDINDILVLSTTIPVVEIARDRELSSTAY